ncbi:hypothetical protein ACJRO7_007361 [Eucalyptus globulus]|uniref:Uncharacterized protein n=1 Tax=Eucalyptus globulus TaxID=34317 RepID=A0ABD3IN28_EUCGL
MCRGCPRRPVVDPGVVVHDVKPAVVGHSGVHEVAHIGLDGNVAAGIGGLLAQLRSQGPAQLVLDVGNHDQCAVLVEEACRARADPARAAGGDCDLAI